MAALELALKGKEAELDGLMQTLGLKDRTIQELQQELRRLRAERASAQEKVRELEQEKARLEAELSELQSQVRIHNLSLGDLQDRLTQAYADKEELARKLKLAEEALRDKVFNLGCRNGACNLWHGTSNLWYGTSNLWYRTSNL